MNRYTIGYINRPTNDRRTLTALTFPDVPVPIFLPGDQGQIGTAAAFAIDDEGAVTCETDYPLRPFDCLTMRLDTTEFVLGPGPTYEFKGHLIHLQVGPLYEWPWEAA